MIGVWAVRSDSGNSPSNEGMTSCASLISTNSGVDVHTSRNKIFAASSNASASSLVRRLNRRTTSLLYRARMLDGGERPVRVGRWDGVMPQTDSMAQSRKRVHGLRGSEDCESRSTGSTGGGGVMLEPAGMAQEGPRREASRKM